MHRVDELTPGVFRISTFDPDVGITFNQFLIVDDEPALVHTGAYPMYEGVRQALAKVMDPARLRYIVVPHFEADECGGMGRFVESAPNAELVCSEVGSMINLKAWDYSGPVRGMRDSAVIELGRHRLQFWETPHVHHWDSMMVIEETTRALFPADLFIQPGEQEPVCRQDLGAEMCALYRQAGIFGGKEPVLQVAERTLRANLEWIHPMHGGSLKRELHGAFVRALQEKPFTYEGMLFGRNVAAG